MPQPPHIILLQGYQSNFLYSKELWFTAQLKWPQHSVKWHVTPLLVFFLFPLSLPGLIWVACHQLRPWLCQAQLSRMCQRRGCSRQPPGSIGHRGCEGKCWEPPAPVSQQAPAGEWQSACWEWIWVLKGCTSTFQFVHKSPCNSIIWQLACLGLIFNPQVGGRSLRISSLLELFSLHKGST